MNLIQIDKQFKELKIKENFLSYKYQPFSKNTTGTRHTYFKDLQKDFEDEINTFLFSPYIQGIIYNY